MYGDINQTEVDEAINTLTSYDDMSVCTALDMINPKIARALVVSTGPRKTEQVLYKWDGQRYRAADATGLERDIIESITVMNARLQQRIEAITGTDEVSGRERSTLKKKITELSKFLNTSRRRSLETTIRTLKTVDSKDAGLDADRTRINLENGVYDLLQHKLEEHDPSQRFTCMLPFEYDPDARAPKFMEHLDYVLPDPVTRQYLLEVLASSLLRSRREEFVFFLWGRTAGNGKSELMRMVITALGEYATWLDPHTFTTRRAANATQPEMMMALGKALATVDEPSKDGIDASAIKNTANYADIVLRGLYKASKAERWTATCIMLCNTMPPLDAKDAGIARRPVVIPFNRQITAEMKARDKRPPEYNTMKYGEYVGTVEAPGIFNLLITALVDHQLRGCILPPMSPEMREATDEYIYKNNAVARYVAEHFTKDDKAAVNAREFHYQFKEYCTEELGYDEKKVMLPASIREAMEAMGYHSKVVCDRRTDRKSQRCYEGLRPYKPTSFSPVYADSAPLRKDIVEYLRLCSPVQESSTDRMAAHFSSVTPELLEATLKKMKEVGEVIDLGGNMWGYVSP